jgi:hypothetical protein
MSIPEPEPMHAVARVEPQRSQLLSAQLGFEAAFDPAVSDGSSPGAALDALRAAFTTHVDYTEGPDGLFAAMQYDEPDRSASDIDRLRRDHITISNTIDRVGEYLGADPGTTDGGRLQESVAELSRLLTAHRRRGTDLTYNIYEVDIGGDG